MPNGVTPAGLIGKGMRLTGARGALGISDIDASAMQVLNMLSEYSTKLSERRLSGGEQATKVEKEQKKKGDLWGYGSGAAAFAALLVLGIDPKTASSVSGITSAAVRKWAEDQARLDVGVGGISLGAGELPLPPKPKYYKSQYGKLSTMRGEAKLDLESLYQAGRQMALPRALSTGYNVYRGGNLLSDVFGLGADKTLGDELDWSQFSDPGPVTIEDFLGETSLGLASNLGRAYPEEDPFQQWNTYSNIFPKGARLGGNIFDYFQNASTDMTSPEMTLDAGGWGSGAGYL
jgi:hypothetical protein